MTDRLPGDIVGRPLLVGAHDVRHYVSPKPGAGAASAEDGEEHVRRQFRYMHDNLIEKRIFDYSAFIEELIPLVEQARAFQPMDSHAKSDVFRKWRHEVLDLVTRINRLRYNVNCTIEHRYFVVMGYGSYTERQQREQFDRDLKDTLVELDVVIDRFKKYGDPKAKDLTFGSPLAKEVAPPAPAPEPLKFPDKVTLHWLFQHLPLSAWVGLAIFVGGTFTFGVTVGNWTTVQAWIVRVLGY